MSEISTSPLSSLDIRAWKSLMIFCLRKLTLT